MNTYNILLWAVRLAGVGQIFIALVYFWLRRIVGWSADLARLRPLNRAVANTYSRYIQALNTIFGLICIFQTRALLQPTVLAQDLTLLIAVYWLVRLSLQFFYYDDREITAQPPLYRFGARAFTLLFAYLGAALLAAFAQDVGWLKL